MNEAPFTKQQKERLYFEQFWKIHSIPGRIEYSDKPDVLIINDDIKLGIELTHLYKVDGDKFNNEQIQNRLRIKVIEKAEALYLRQGGRRIELFIDFDPSHPIKDVKKLANELVDIALKVSHSTQGHQSRSSFPETPELRFLYHNGQSYPDSKWKLSQGHDVPRLAIPRAKELIAQKIEKLPNYQVCDRYWLLLIIDFWDPAQDQELDEWPLSEKISRTPFEKIFIYKSPFNKVIEIPQ
ncbi:hypothetical protein hmeg3_17390 [Herbaspirillum sp. meg3]|uniref:hypothetical protein n=1 Tax=Herbaspirillum sp. meg3 TaxID=2025949 RepID=UPI000B991F61|nr:hypothetical protein [Herbaspirillum sp. meg3]ASU39884.1 hypothetical protein hmeg3_17390 [Herbaspirillum sp. meg3]